MTALFKKHMTTAEAEQIQKNQEQKCQKGEHRFVEADEWEATCIFCGKFEEK